MVEDIIFDALLKDVTKNESLIEVANSDITVPSQVILENINLAIDLINQPSKLLLQAVKLNAYFENFSMNTYAKKSMPDLETRDFIFNISDYINSQDEKYLKEVENKLNYFKTSFEEVIVRERVELVSLISEQTFLFLEEFFADDLLIELAKVARVTQATLKKWQKEGAPTNNYNFAPIQVMATCFYFLREEGMTNQEILNWYKKDLNGNPVKDLLNDSRYWLEPDLVNYFKKKGINLEFFVADII